MASQFLGVLATVLGFLVQKITEVDDEAPERKVVGRLRATSREVCAMAGQGDMVNGKLVNYKLAINRILNRLHDAKVNFEVSEALAGRESLQHRQTVSVYRDCLRLLTPRRAMPKALARRAGSMPEIVRNGTMGQVVNAAHVDGFLRRVRVGDQATDLWV